MLVYQRLPTGNLALRPWKNIAICFDAIVNHIWCNSLWCWVHLSRTFRHPPSVENHHGIAALIIDHFRLEIHGFLGIPSWLEEPPNMDHMGYEFQLLVILNPINRSNVPYFIPSTIPDPHWPLRPRPWAVTAWAKRWRAWAKVDDLGVSLVYETSICMYIYIYIYTHMYIHIISYIYIYKPPQKPRQY